MSLSDYDCVVLDIEGTTTPITFVKDTLFPYVLQGLNDFLDRTWGSTELDKHIDLLREQAAADVRDNVCHAVIIPAKDGSSDQSIKEAVRRNIAWQMEADRKIGALKAFQGLMWKEGYESGELKGEIYDDVVPALKKWCQAGKSVYIYSSGSVPAQKLLLGYSTKGDLLKYFKGYFDTTVGLKVEAASYQKIALEIGKETDKNRILFVSDNIREIISAKEAGYQVVISDRPGNACLGPESKEFKIIHTFDQI